MTSSAASSSLRQLRLALVCDGGVSLAIYMHGVCKELHKLVRASRAFDAAYDRDAPAIAQAPNPFDVAMDTEYAYFEELRDLASAGRPISVVIDIVAGTSAGGINAVCLAKVIATNGSQDALRELWMHDGDLRRLLVAPRMGWLWPQAAAAVLRVAVGILTRRHTYLLHGDRMSQWLFDAIAGMSTSSANIALGETLVPEGKSVELFVTTTDLHGFDVLVPAGGGGPSQHAVDHRQVLTFRYEPGDGSNRGRHGDFAAGNTGALAFAARATSAFPAAFPPVSIDTFIDAELAGHETTRSVTADSITQRLRWQHPDLQHTRAAWCADGGLLDNQPFDLAIAAIAAKRAETQVVRRLIYIDPNPSGPLAVPVEDTKLSAAMPGPLAELKDGLLSARGDQPVLHDLITLRDINLRIGQIGEVVTQEMGDVLAAVDSIKMGRLGRLERDDVAAMTKAVHGVAAARLGPTFRTYCRLKLEAAVDAIADRLEVAFSYPPGSNRSTFARAVLQAWCHRQPGWDTADKHDNDALIALLNQIDVPYRMRRLQFLLSGVNSLYDLVDRSPGAPSIGQLNALKKEAWDLLDGIRAATATAMQPLIGSRAGFLSEEALSADRVLEDPAVFAATYATDIHTLVRAYAGAMETTFDTTTACMWSAFTDHTQGWDDGTKEKLVSRYVAFPLWDAFIFPTIALAPVPQFSPIAVARFSPHDAHYLDGLRPHKLQGTTVHHFGGFLKASYRENDYLWGRLDGAEQCLQTLRAATTDTGTSDAVDAHLRDALTAILTAEQQHLPTTKNLRDDLLNRLNTH
jgi:patatin-related protein